MKHIALHGTARTKGRKSLTKSIRREGQVPCNLYGNGVENVLFSVDARDLKALTHTPNSYIVDLDIDGKNYLAILHELQFHPVTDNTIHADFLAISADKPVTINVPLNIFGNCAGVKAGGKLLIEARKLRSGYAVCPTRYPMYSTSTSPTSSSASRSQPVTSPTRASRS